MKGEYRMKRWNELTKKGKKRRLNSLFLNYQYEIGDRLNEKFIHSIIDDKNYQEEDLEQIRNELFQNKKDFSLLKYLL